MASMMAGQHGSTASKGVTEIRYIAYKELITSSVMILKSHPSSISTANCLRTLQRVLKMGAVFKDACRDAGLLDVICDLIGDYQPLLARSGDESTQQQDHTGHEHHDLVRLDKVDDEASLETVVELLLQLAYEMVAGPNNQTCAIFTESGAAKHVFAVMANCSLNKEIRKWAFMLCQQLILSNSGEDHLVNLLALLHRDSLTADSSPETLQREVSLKSSLLKTLLIVLRESHRCRALFRKAGGFVYLMSVLIGMESALNFSEEGTNRDQKMNAIESAQPQKIESSASQQKQEKPNPWLSLEPKKVWNLLKLVFSSLTTAMRFEPANAKFFATEIASSSLTDSVRLLGCFTNETYVSDSLNCAHSSTPTSTATHRRDSFDPENYDSPYRDLFCTSLFELTVKPNMTRAEASCLVMRFLYDMALDAPEKSLGPAQFLYPSSSSQQQQMQRDQSSIGSKSSGISATNDKSSISSSSSPIATSASNSKPPPPKPLQFQHGSSDPPLIIHSTVVSTIFNLVPSLPNDNLQLFIMEVIRSLLKSERNQQVMAEASLVSEILSDRWNSALQNESHILHPPVQYIFERLASHLITAKELRTFLRLGSPLNCIPFDEVFHNKYRFANQRDGGPISLNRIKTLVSMSTTKDANSPHRLQPPFVEFDMSQEGFSFLFLPSIAPVCSSSTSSHPNSSGTSNVLANALAGASAASDAGAGGITGGIGTGERPFPPQAGLTFLSWFCVERFSAPSEDAHNVRLLCIYRGAQNGHEYACLQIEIAARDKALLISTQENRIFYDNEKNGGVFDPEYNMRIWTPELIQEGQWHHIAVVLNRAVLKNSTASVYIDGTQVTSQKLHYISSVPGHNAGISNVSASYVNSFIGTPPQWRRPARLIWKQGQCHLIEEPLSAHMVSAIHSLGPNYIGSYQGTLASDFSFSRIVSSTGSQSSGSSSSQSTALSPIEEDRIVFGLNARATSVMTLARMRRVYSRFDCRQLSKILGLSSHENATPINVVHNSAGHLSGASRSLGAVLIGYLGARYFVPKPVTVTIYDIGGCALLLGLVANSQDTESLYASVKALCCILRVNRELQMEMERINGYQTLAMLLRRKRHFLNCHVLQLTFNLVGTIDLGRRPSLQRNGAHHSHNEGLPSMEIKQSRAFKDLLCDQIDLWAQNDLLKTLLEHFNELLLQDSTNNVSSAHLSNNASTNSSHNKNNSGHSPVHSQGSCANDPRVKNLKLLREMSVLSRLLQLLRNQRITDMKMMHLIKVLIYSLLSQTPRKNDLLYFGQFIASLLPINPNDERADDIIDLRNSMLKIVLQLMTRNGSHAINEAVQEELVRILGFDWFLLFLLGSHLHPDTLTIGLVNLMVLLSNKALQVRFKNGTSNGSWLKDTEAVLENRFSVQLLGFNVASTNKSGQVRIIRHDLFTLPGFQHLTWLMGYHIHQPKVYLILFQGILGCYANLTITVLDAIENFEQLTLDNLWNCTFGADADSRCHIASSTATGGACHDIALSVLGMVQSIIWGTEEQSEGLATYPVTLIHFLMYLYHNRKDFQNYCVTSIDFINALCQTVLKENEPGSQDGRATQCESETKYQQQQSQPQHQSTPQKLQSQSQHSSSPSSVDSAIKQLQATERTSSMTDHLAKKPIMDFIQLIIMDSLTGPTTNLGLATVKGPVAVLEAFLDALLTCKQAQTELLHSLMEQIGTFADIIAQHHSSLSLSSMSISMGGSSSGGLPSASYHQMHQIHPSSASTNNIVLFTRILVEKLWQEVYTKDAKEVLDFELKLLTKLNLSSSGPTPSSSSSSSSSSGFLLSSKSSKSSAASNISPNSELSMLYRALNRTVLFLLSRPLETIADRLNILEVLQRIHSARQLILISYCNQDAEFYACLTHCLLQLIDEGKISLHGKMPRSTWYVKSPTNDGNDKSFEDVADEGALLVASVAKKIWEEIYLSKKSLLEEALKISLNSSTPAFGVTSITPELSSLRDALYEPTLRVWVAYMEGEQQKQRRARCSSASSLDSPSAGSPTAGSITEKLSGNVSRFTKVVHGVGFVTKIVGGTTGAVSGAISSAVGGVAGAASGKKEVFRSMSSSAANEALAAKLAPTPHWNVMSRKDVEQWTLTHLSIISDLIALQVKQKHQSDAHLVKYVYEDWLGSESELLLREKAVWGPEFGSRLDKWKLDLTEGPHRMRKKLIKNESFYLHYPYRVEYDNCDSKALKYKLPISYDSKEYYKRFRPESHALVDREATVDTDDEVCSSPNFLSKGHQSPSPIPPGQAITADSSSPALAKGSSTDQDAEASMGFVDVSSEVAGPGQGGGGDAGSVDVESESIDSQTVLRLLEEGEKITHMFRCARVEGLDTFEGLLLFGREHFYLVDGFTLLKTREIKDIDSLPPNQHNPIIPNASPRGSFSSATKPRHTKKSCAKFSYDLVCDVLKRRYLLQPIALEVFCLDGRNSLLVFPRKLRNKVYNRFFSLATAIADNTDSLSGQKRNASVESGAGILGSLIGETSVTQRWVRGEISNFQYLMHLNTLAGRSYNDLMQYPIFPWVLADYSSSELDLSSPTSYRDLSKPMGAQTPDRLEQFIKRFQEWDDPHGETPPYHYGTFYSSAMIVASYLVRMEPFTQHFLHLQGGHFDLADRMFHSVGDAWLSAAKNNMADVKELIPEFFYLPEFLANSNRFDLGVKQSGVRLDDVVLPPWAKDDPREFIRLHRAALESDYVSAHLHEWIDLIFGYKQQGPPAVESVNVFHHLFYEGNVDIYSIDDPLKKNATIGFINNFGQIPAQLFKKPHPVKKVIGSQVGGGASGPPLTPILPSVSLQAPSFMIGVSSSSQVSVDKVFYRNVELLRPSLQPVKELRSAVGQIVQQEKALLAVEQNKVLIPPIYKYYVAWGFADHSLRIGQNENEKNVFIQESDIVPPNGEIMCCTAPNNRIVITGGTSAVISVWKIKSKIQQLQLIQNLYGHTEVITALASSQNYGVIVSGGRDRNCIVWDLNRLVFKRQLGGGGLQKLVHPGPVAAVAINDLSGDIATCSSNWIFFWSINGDLIASVDTLSIPRPVYASKKSSFSTPSQNIGPAVAAATQILCVAFSTLNEWDAQNVILTGSSDGVVRIWSVEFTQIPIEDDDDGRRSSGSSEIDSSGSITPSPSELTKPHMLAPSKEEIVRRMSLASKEGSDHHDDDESTTTTDDNRSVDLLERHDGEWVQIGDLDDDGAPLIKADDMDSPSEKVPAINIGTGTAPTADTRLARQAKEPSGPKLMIPQMPQSKSTSEFLIVTPPSKTQSGREADSNSPSSQNQVDSNQGKKTSDSKSKPGKGQGGACLDIPKIRTSKSDTSLIDSFIMVNNEKGAGSSASELKPGHKWVRRLCFRSKLTMHTAFDRKDNQEPAAVTALAVSRDHKTVYVGDARGRIFSWSVAESRGGLSDHWVKDEQVEHCTNCSVKFSLTERRHHCRNCGHVFCSRCSKYEAEIPRLKINRPVRVCSSCFSLLNAANVGSSSSSTPAPS